MNCMQRTSHLQWYEAFGRHNSTVGGRWGYMGASGDCHWYSRIDKRALGLFSGRGHLGGVDTFVFSSSPK